MNDTPAGWLGPEGGPTTATLRSFAAAVVHNPDIAPADAEHACVAYADRWSRADLAHALRFAGRIAPLPQWAARLLTALGAADLRADPWAVAA